MKPETFYARIFGRNEDDFQDVFVYIHEVEDNTAYCEIKIPLMIEPTCLRGDVETWLWEHDFGLRLGKLEYQMYPQQTYIAP